MNIARRIRVLPLLVWACSSVVEAQISKFEHIVVIVQENRTPDNLFQGLCLPPYGKVSACGTGFNQYDIQSYGWDQDGDQIQLQAVPLSNTFDPGHQHSAFETMCNPSQTTFYPCSRNTGLSTANCTHNEKTSLCSFQYVNPDPSVTPSLGSYLYVAQNFAWANIMFQTNQGPSAPAHQFLFGGTSAASAYDDRQAIFVADNPSNGLGCVAPSSTINYYIDPGSAPTVISLTGTLCISPLSRTTLTDLFENEYGTTWAYYAVSTSDTEDSIWTAPNWFQDICEPSGANCTGAEWKNNVILDPSQVLTDASSPACDLRNMVWVTPTGQNSDHPSSSGTHVGGPLWVASIINAINSSSCTDQINGKAVPYWEDTAIVVTWDDWGGFYDHVLPPFLSPPTQGQGDYQLGFRVPLLFVSAYTAHTIDSFNQYDFGSILRFVEHNFGIPEGVLGFADARSTTDLTAFYDLRRPPARFPIPTYSSTLGVDNSKEPPDPPDDY
jgi:phospholipase C